MDDTVQIRFAPESDNQTTMDPASISQKLEEQYVLNSLFTGGFNRATRAHLMDKLIESEPEHPQMAGAKGSACEMPGCNAKVMTDERGADILPCECGFKICRDCYADAVISGGGICPGCKQPYKKRDLYESETAALEQISFAMKPKSQLISEEDFGGIDTSESKPWRPLTQKIKPPASVLGPICFLVILRGVVLAMFFAWRISHPNNDALCLWGMSVVCEIWFAFSWLLDQLPKLRPITRSTDLKLLKEKFERPKVKSDLPGVDIYVTTADPEKEPPLVTANTILSILAADYPVEKLACYVSDDAGSLLTYEAMAETKSFAGSLWVPFCRKHDIEIRNPESYFDIKRKDPCKNKYNEQFVRDRKIVKEEYDKFKVRINGLKDSIRERSDGYNKKENNANPNALWMADGTPWPGTWLSPATDHSPGDHTGMIQVMLSPPSDAPLLGRIDSQFLDLRDVDIRLPLLVYVSRDKRPGYDHNKKAGAMNSLVRASAILSNGPFILNLDCDHYIYNPKALREGICFMMDRGGDRLCYVQFPQRFEGIDPSDRYNNRNTVFFDVTMRALDGIMGPFYVGTGCLFRRTALYGFDPPRSKEYSFSCSFFGRQKKQCFPMSQISKENLPLSLLNSDDEKKKALFGDSKPFIDSMEIAEKNGLPLGDHPSVKNGRPPGALTSPRKHLDKTILDAAIRVISCWYEDSTQWGDYVGWVYGSITEDVVTGYKMHNRGWKSAYCVTKPDAFRGTAPINLTDRLHQALRWATGSVEIFFSPNNAFFASQRMKLLQKIAYLNVGIYPFTSIFLVVYCFVPALSLFSDQFIVKTVNVTYLTYLLIVIATLCLLSLLEIKWSGIELEELWRNEQFWMVGGTSSHLFAVLQGLLKAVCGVEISFTVTSKSAGDDAEDEFADLYIFKWTPLMIPPIMIITVNVIAMAIGFGRAIYSVIPQWSRVVGGVFLSLWVLAHLYPFALGFVRGREKIPTIVCLWSGIIAIITSLLYVAINPPSSGITELGLPVPSV